MKPARTLCLALILGALVAGCSTPHKTLTAQSHDGSPANSPANESIITGLGSGFSITATANSWPELIQKTHPAFAWKGRDLMWIESDDHGQPRFVLDEAYLYQPTNQPRQWILLQEGSREAAGETAPESPRFFYSDQNLHAVASLHDHLPPIVDDAGERGDYAIALDNSRQFGTVYEIGWQCEMGTGTAHPCYGRRIYVLHDHNDHWQFLGEGPAEGAERGGATTLESSVIWSDSSASVTSPQILIQSQDTTLPWTYAGDTNSASPEVTITNDYLLRGGFPASSR